MKVTGASTGIVVHAACIQTGSDGSKVKLRKQIHTDFWSDSDDKSD